MKTDTLSETEQNKFGIPDDCVFYQTMDLPGMGVIEGLWDHREATDVYLGRVDFKGKRVLDVGPASGFFSFEMEKRGATVVAIDLGKEADWDAVPHPGADMAASKEILRNNVRIVENAFWFAHKLLNSKVQLVYGSVYDTPKLMDKVDVALMSNVLQHFRDPFLAIEQVAKVVNETMVITESLWVDDDKFNADPVMRLIPAVTVPHCTHSWWQTSPRLVTEILKLLDFPQVRCEFHKQRFNGTRGDPGVRLVSHFTVTGTRAST